jgi:hypothetical protein
MPPPAAIRVPCRLTTRAGAAQGEIHNVIASLRLGGASSVGLLQDFKALHDSLCEVSSRTAITEIDALSYFEPFLALLQSEQTSGVVTHVRPRSPHTTPHRRVHTPPHAAAKRLKDSPSL